MHIKHKRDISESPPVLLLDGGIVSLSVARSLGRKGIPVYTLNIPQNHARFSKYSNRLQFTGKNIEDWVQWLSGDALEQIRGAVIFPCSDSTIEMVSRYREQLSDYYILPESNDDLMLAMLDKAETYKIADRIGIPAPKTWCVNSVEDLESIVPDIPFPCALKPRFSHEYRGRNILKKLFVVNNKEELFAEFKGDSGYTKSKSCDSSCRNNVVAIIQTSNSVKAKTFNLILSAAVPGAEFAPEILPILNSVLSNEKITSSEYKKIESKLRTALYSEYGINANNLSLDQMIEIIGDPAKLETERQAS